MHDYCSMHIIEVNADSHRVLFRALVTSSIAKSCYSTHNSADIHIGSVAVVWAYAQDPV